MSDPTLDDAEIDALMAEIEAQNAEFASATPTPTPTPTAAPAAPAAVEAAPVPQVAPTTGVAPWEDAAEIVVPEAKLTSPDPTDDAEIAAALAEIETPPAPEVVEKIDDAEIAAALAEIETPPAPEVVEKIDGATVGRDMEGATSVATESVALKVETSETAKGLETAAVAVAAAIDAIAAVPAPTAATRRISVAADGSVTKPTLASSAESFLSPEELVDEDKPVTGQQSALNYYVDVRKFNLDTRVTEATLDACMMEQASLRSFYGSQAAQAEGQASRLKAAFEIHEARLYDKHRKLLAASGEKVTEKMVENAVKLDPTWGKAKNRLIEAETIAAVNKSLVASIGDRKDMLVQLGADRREELKGQLRITSKDDTPPNPYAARAAAALNR